MCGFHWRRRPTQGELIVLRTWQYTDAGFSVPINKSHSSRASAFPLWAAYGLCLCSATWLPQRDNPNYFPYMYRRAFSRILYIQTQTFLPSYVLTGTFQNFIHSDTNFFPSPLYKCFFSSFRHPKANFFGLTPIEVLFSEFYTLKPKLFSVICINRHFLAF